MHCSGINETLRCKNFYLSFDATKSTLSLWYFFENKVIEVKSPTVDLEWRRDSIGTAETFRCSYRFPENYLSCDTEGQSLSGQIEQDLRLSIYAHLLSIFLHEQIWIVKHYLIKDIIVICRDTLVTQYDSFFLYL